MAISWPFFCIEFPLVFFARMKRIIRNVVGHLMPAHDNMKQIGSVAWVSRNHINLHGSVTPMPRNLIFHRDRSVQDFFHQPHVCKERTPQCSIGLVLIIFAPPGPRGRAPGMLPEHSRSSSGAFRRGSRAGMLQKCSGNAPGMLREHSGRVPARPRRGKNNKNQPYRELWSPVLTTPAGSGGAMRMSVRARDPAASGAPCCSRSTTIPGSDGLWHIRETRRGPVRSPLWPKQHHCLQSVARSNVGTDFVFNPDLLLKNTSRLRTKFAAAGLFRAVAGCCAAVFTGQATHADPNGAKVSGVLRQQIKC